MGYCLYKCFDFRADAMDIVDLFKDKPFMFFLDSSLVHPHLGRYSWIGFDPFHVCQLNGGDCLTILKKAFSLYQEDLKQPTSPFFSGIVGYLSYDLGLAWENIRCFPKEETTAPQCLFGFYDGAIVIDHYQHKLYIYSNGLPEKKRYWRQKRAAQRLNSISQKLKEIRFVKWDPRPFVPRISLKQEDHRWESDFAKETYLRAVQKALDYIRRGDIYQVNLAQKFSLRMNKEVNKTDALRLYRALRMLSPSCFGAYFDSGSFQLMSTSPERFLRLEKNVVTTRPMKGTRRRGKSFNEDQKLRFELLRSSKDKAELLMITDLERNDLGRVCEYGSIQVKEMRTMEEYSTVFQATSTIQGILRKGKDGFDVLRACFPGGSVTGCPKIRAMEIIEELEPSRRSIYTGTLGYMSFSGSMDFNILIRTLLLRNKEIHVHAGSGIVSDSHPQKEYEETLIKAMAIRACVNETLKGPRKFNSFSMTYPSRV